MKYYRLVFKKEDDRVGVSEITEQDIPDQDFQKMNWEKPIIRHYDGKYLHFISLDAQYLDAMLAGINAYVEMSNNAPRGT